MSGFLLDTNVISELIKPMPETRVRDWVDAADESLLFLSVLTVGEIRKGITALKDRGRRIVLEGWLDGELLQRFAGRILPIDQAVADRWGRISGEALSRRLPLPVIDALLAATALQHEMTLITRNTKDMGLRFTHVSLFNPWLA